MFVDASALTAMLVAEHDARELLARLQNSTIRTTSPLAIWETVLAVARILGLDIKAANIAVEEFLVLASINVEPVPPDARHSAVDAFVLFSKGRHSAALNFGDCFAYACAKQAGLPLLYKGDDFPPTDIESA